MAGLAAAGFTPVTLRECPPQRHLFGDDEAEFARRCRVRLFLLLAATVTASPGLVADAGA